MVNKKAALGLLQCRIEQGRNSKQIEERAGGVKEKPLKENDTSCQPEPYLMEKYKIIGTG